MSLVSRPLYSSMAQVTLKKWLNFMLLTEVVATPGCLSWWSPSQALVLDLSEALTACHSEGMCSHFLPFPFYPESVRLNGPCLSVSPGGTDGILGLGYREPRSPIRIRPVPSMGRASRG